MAKLYFYYAAMNAGKSTTLLQADFNYRERGMRTLLFTAAFDDRFEPGKITSRIGLASHATAIDEETDLYEEIAIELAEGRIDCVLVDEAQWLTRTQVFQLAAVCDELDIPVLAYGLRSDFQVKLFPGSAALLAIADNLIELKAVCACGRKATMNLRINAEGFPVKEGAQIEVGGNERYVALCRRHYTEQMGWRAGAHIP
ncbi:thymidine kinase [Rhizorhabdus dicambivorans]|uniref:Thymidine kinase n=1 Tax=Rhizorhabdus dicambivorans TaxID=1850238 RepID=A0A2A4FUU9_9SPHN|nr:thymidine kinase [Rhizorhabdus dicambivorans]ATE66915.1 thymidine kinase [Rhizorhabdus dicambivorans]PCE42215.1 thymidine kinase [Rhizorhabdus dicambivorans]